jgi:hypothetical protein
LNALLEAQSVLSSIFASAPTGTNTLHNKVEKLIQNGFFSGNLRNLTTAMIFGDNSSKNIHSNPPKSIYPRVTGDVPYSIPEQQLRAAIRIPWTFTHGKKQPVILVPGTGSTGFFTFNGNYIKLLSRVDYADPVWLNIPNFLLDDAQKNAVSNNSTFILY